MTSLLKRTGKINLMAHLHHQITQHSLFPYAIRLVCRSTSMETISSAEPKETENGFESARDAAAIFTTRRESTPLPQGGTTQTWALMHPKEDHFLQASVGGSARPSLASDANNMLICAPPSSQTLTFPFALRAAAQIPLEISQVVSIPERI